MVIDTESMSPLCLMSLVPHLAVLRTPTQRTDARGAEGGGGDGSGWHPPWAPSAPDARGLGGKHSFIFKLNNRAQAVNLALATLSFDFVGTCLDESSEDLGTIQVPPPPPLDPRGFRSPAGTYAQRWTVPAGCSLGTQHQLMCSSSSSNSGSGGSGGSSNSGRFHVGCCVPRLQGSALLLRTTCMR